MRIDSLIICYLFSVTLNLNNGIKFNSNPFLCPASSLITTDTDKILSYPQIYFQGEFLKRVSYNCSFWYRGHPKNSIDQCAPRLCPIRHENIVSAGDVPWPTRVTNLCDITHINYPSGNMSSTRVVKSLNLIFLGGSFTAGSNTRQACCCDWDAKCPPHLPCIHYTRSGHDYYCAWPGFFSRWLQKLLPSITITVHNLAESGATSRIMANRLGDILRRKKVIISQNDIVFIDHSVNDAEYLGTKGRITDVQQGVELLVRELIRNAKDHRPHIIFVDQWPHNGPNPSKDKPADFANSVSGIYRSVARYYRLPLWSYREFVWSDFASTNQSHFIHMVRSLPTHTPWHTHLLVADIISGVFLRTLRESCVHRSSYSLSSDSHSHSQNHSSYGPTDVSVSDDLLLPDTLYDVRLLEHDICNDSMSVLMDASPFQYSPITTTTAGNWNMTSEQGWHLLVDHNGVSGWAITSQSQSHTRDLSFRFNATDMDKPISSTAPAIVKVTYLRTYENAGTVDLFMCGRLAKGKEKSGEAEPWHIDALHEDFRRHRVSVPEVAVFEWTHQEQQRCVQQGDDNDPTKRHLVVSYVISKSHLSARGNQKFKVLNIKICFPLSSRK
eukprot:gene6156-12466_t